jgi:hypothetical protein
MSHHCHATYCTTKVPPEMFMCKKHWFMLPKPIRDRIWQTYRLGQCDDWNITHEYANAAREGVAFIAQKEGVKPDVSVYDMLDPKNKEGEDQ